MAKCPISFDCGSEFVLIDEGKKIDFEIKNVPKDTVCIYNIYTNFEEEKEKFTFKVGNMDKWKFIGGVYSNNNTNINDAISGIVSLNFEFKEK